MRLGLRLDLQFDHRLATVVVIVGVVVGADTEVPPNFASNDRFLGPIDVARHHSDVSIDASTINTNATGGKAMDIIGVSFTAAGGTAVAGGLIWHFLEPVGAPAAPAGFRLTPWVGRGGGFVAQAEF